MRTFDILKCAEFLKIERSYALKLAGEGKLPGAKIGKAWVFLEEDIIEYLRKEVQQQMRERQSVKDQEELIQQSLSRQRTKPGPKPKWQTLEALPTMPP